MKSIFKKSAAIILTVCVLLSILTINVFAKGSSSVAFSKNTVNLKETLTVTARFSTSSGDPMYALEGYLTYDPKVIKFVSGDSCSLLTDGKVKFVLTSDGKINLSANVKFTALAAGKSTVALEQLIYVDKNDTEQSISGASATVTVTNPSTQASSNANLRKLGVSAGTLTPAFSPDVTSYNVTIPYEETELWVQPELADQKATYVVEGGKDMKVGHNKRVIIVTAENGKTKSYTVNVTRLDQSGNTPSTEIEDPVNDMIEVTVDGETLYVNENFATDSIPAGFEIVDHAFNEKTVPALSDDNIILLNLIKPDGSDAAFYVKNADGSFIRLKSLTVGGATYYIFPANEIPEGYSEMVLTVGEQEITAYTSSNADEKEFALIYAQGPSGNTGFYRYDTVEATIQRAPAAFITAPATDNDDKAEDNSGNLLEEFNKLNQTGKIIALTILGIMVLLIIVIIILIVKLIIAIVNSAKERKLRKLEAEAEDQVGFDYVSIGGNETLVTEESEDIETTEEITSEETELNEEETDEVKTTEE